MTRFDAEDRALILGWAMALPERTLRSLIERPSRSVVLAVLTVLAIRVWRKKRRILRDPQVEAYERTLRRLGLRRTLAETPRELLDRARSLELRPEQLADLEAATSVHEATRYGARIRLAGNLS